ncbi:MAG: N-methyl-L-tryptophan oxidase [Crocosphaera sp.]|nr:N-methyl-L-tryptophan oxidase [Crocosphaera sp.]
MTNNFDVIILGAGGIGSAAAYYLAKSKQRVLVLEQFSINHDKGSSYGYSRVIRYAYDNPIYVKLMRAAYPLWFALEKEANETLYIKTGELDFGPLNAPSMQEVANSMTRENIPYETLTAAEINQRFPQFTIPETMEGLYQEDTGILKASRCVLTHLKLAQKYGAIIEDKTPVINIQRKPQEITVKTNNNTYVCQQLIIAAGSWTKQLLIPLGLTLPLTIMPCQLAFFKVENSNDYIPSTFTIFLAHLSEDYGQFPYGLPACDHQGLKLSTFYGWGTVESIKEVDYTPSLQWIETLRSFLKQYLPNANGELIETRRCLYTMTPDKHFIVDQHPEYANIFIAAGFSGHGFKFTTLVGKILTDLVTKKETEYDLSLFKINRFL